jgi:hypothetical protein
MSWRSKQGGGQADEGSAPVAAAEEELAQRLAGLTHREAALRRITEVVEKQRTELEERERALEKSTSAAVAGGRSSSVRPFAAPSGRSSASVSSNRLRPRRRNGPSRLCP